MKKEILKGAGVLLITVAMILSTLAVTANTIYDTTTYKLSSDDNTHVESPRIIDLVRVSSLFLQLPHDPDESWSASTSCFDPGSPIDHIVYENFWEVAEPICDIHWWGLSLFFTGSTWVQCDPTGMTFNITFYQDVAGKPGHVVCSCDPVSPTITDTGKLYHSVIQAHLYLFELDLDPCCNLTKGWVSIQSYVTSNKCWFLWMSAKTGDGDSLQDLNDGNGPQSTDYDRAIELTGEEPPTPVICCDPVGLDWEGVKPGATLTGQIYVCNCGDSGSFLNWEVDKWPPWGTWTFTPSSGTGVAEGDYDIIDVTVIAPPDKNTSFSGKIKVINSDDPNDFCEMDTSLKTPKNKAFNFNLDLLEWLFERFPNAFVILRYMLGL